MLNDMNKKRLQTIYKGLKELDDLLIDDSAAFHALDAQKNEHGEFVLQGNMEGLVHLACAILSLTQNPFTGKHHHFDNLGVLEDNAKPFIVTFKNADWETEGADDEEE